MEQRAKPDADVITIVAEPGALTFATRKEWTELPAEYLDELQQHAIEYVFCGSQCVFIMMKNLLPSNYFKAERPFLLVKISVDKETGKQLFSIMSLSRGEKQQLMRNRLALLE